VASTADRQVGTDLPARGRTHAMNARRIINGLDRAQKIASYATRLEKILRRSRVPMARQPPR
jgi:hypothetical protein